MLSIAFDQIASDTVHFEKPEDRLLHIRAHLRIIDTSLVIDANDFPVLDLAVDLDQWLWSLPRDNFEFVSRIDEERGAVWIRETAPSRWTVGSQRTKVTSAEYSTADLEPLIARFVDDVAAGCKKAFGRSMSDLFQGRRAWEKAASTNNHPLRFLGLFAFSLALIMGRHALRNERAAEPEQSGSLLPWLVGIGFVAALSLAMVAVVRTLRGLRRSRYEESSED